MQSNMSIKFLDQLNSSDQIGGKAANLVKLLEGGFNVPNFFVVSDTTFSEQEIIEASQKLNTTIFAVRSSANQEDSAYTSFAGQFDSYLNVAQADLSETIKRCFDTSTNQRLKSYLEVNNLNPEAVVLNVIVQEMVDVEVGGVIFTKNPVNNSDSEVVIELATENIEKVVQGQADTQTIILNKSSGQIISKYGQSSYSISSDLIESLVNSSKSIESQFGLATDIEWAIDKAGLLWILQARPITSH